MEELILLEEMSMDKNDILDYVMNTPGNTNRAVLNSMLNNASGGSGSGGDSDFIIHAEASINAVGPSNIQFVIDSIDKTFDEVNDAYNSGKTLKIIAHDHINEVDRHQSFNLVKAEVYNDGEMAAYYFQNHYAKINGATLEFEVYGITIASDSEHPVYGWTKTGALSGS